MTDCHTQDCAVHEPTLRPCSCGLETRLRARAESAESQLLQSGEARKALQELVRLEHIKLMQPACNHPACNQAWRSEAERIEYVEKWPLAWEAARVALASLDTKL